jgi:hypothetical protein
MARIHPQIDKQQVRARRRLDTQLAQQFEILRGGEHMDRIGEQQNIVSGRQRVADEVSLDQVDPAPLGRAGEPTTRHLASTGSSNKVPRSAGCRRRIARRNKPVPPPMSSNRRCLEKS